MARSGLAIALGGVGAVACIGAEPLGTPAPRTPLPTDLAVPWDGPRPVARAAADRGAEIYERWCAECHGDHGSGDGVAGRVLRPPPTDFTDRAYMWRQRPSWYFDAVSRGVAGTSMPRWDHQLTEQDRWDAAFYVWSLGGHDGDIRRGAVVYGRDCASCHGVGGNAEPSAHLSVADRVRYARGDVAEQTRAAHDGAQLPAGAQDLRAVVEYLWTFLYDPAGASMDVGRETGAGPAEPHPRL